MRTWCAIRAALTDASWHQRATSLCSVPVVEQVPQQRWKRIGETLGALKLLARAENTMQESYGRNLRAGASSELRNTARRASWEKSPSSNARRSSGSSATLRSRARRRFCSSCGIQCGGRYGDARAAANTRSRNSGAAGNVEKREPTKRMFSRVSVAEAALTTATGSAIPSRPQRAGPGRWAQLIPPLRCRLRQSSACFPMRASAAS